MMILTNGLTDVVDEGFLKVANSLLKRLKGLNPDIEIVSYERRSELTDTYIEVNRLMLNKGLFRLCKKHGDVLYVPFPTHKIVMALRTFLLSLYAKKLRIILVLKTQMDFFSRLLLKLSRAEIIVFSREAAEFYADIVGKKRVTYLKTGVDTKKFLPVSEERAKELKNKYGFNPDKKIVLHVGHLTQGRNIRELMKISEEVQVLLVTSTLTKNEQDIQLKEQLLSRGNIKIIDYFIPEIEEIYQLSDVYFFPVMADGRCIDVPLSCMEAAACGKPVITTAFGEMKELIGKPGFLAIDNFDEKTINDAISQCFSGGNHSGEAVKEYDWEFATNYIAKNL